MKYLSKSSTIIIALVLVISGIAVAQTLKGTKIEYTEEDKAKLQKKKQGAQDKFNKNVEESKKVEQEVQRQKEQERMEQIKRVPI
ncbi:hypothetical protein ACFL4E_00460 [Candidatus Omnitrophota bacterium]